MPLGGMKPPPPPLLIHTRRMFRPHHPFPLRPFPPFTTLPPTAFAQDLHLAATQLYRGAKLCLRHSFLRSRLPPRRVRPALQQQADTAMLPTIFTWRDALDTLMATNPLIAMAYSLKLPTITWWREALDTLAATNPLFAAACSTWADIVTGGSGVIVKHTSRPPRSSLSALSAFLPPTFSTLSAHAFLIMHLKRSSHRLPPATPLTRYGGAQRPLAAQACLLPVEKRPPPPPFYTPTTPTTTPKEALICVGLSQLAAAQPVTGRRHLPPQLRLSSPPSRSTWNHAAACCATLHADAMSFSTTHHRHPFATTPPSAPPPAVDAPTPHLCVRVLSEEKRVGRV